MACAAALANLDEMTRLDVVARARALGRRIEPRLRALAQRRPGAEVRGRGALWGLDLHDPALAQRTVVRALERGLVVLPSGLRPETLTLAPPLTIDDAQVDRALDLLEAALAAASGT
jgi:4-aminobutyrate aminotransferase-like enzyme